MCTEVSPIRGPGPARNNAPARNSAPPACMLHRIGGDGDRRRAGSYA